MDNEKLAIFSFYNTPSGLFKWWDEFPLEISEKLKKHNIDHICFYRSYTDNSLHSVNNQNIVKENSLKWLYHIYKLSKKYDHVIFHTHSYYPPLKLFLLTLISPNKSWVITEHRLGVSSAPVWKRRMRELLRNLKLMPKHVISVSNAVLERNKSLYGENVSRIHNGINFPKVTEFNERNSPKIALYVGRLDPKKGIWNLIKAFNIIINEQKRNDLKLIVVGGGNILEKLKAYSEKNNLLEYITFTGYQKDPSAFYQQADYLIIPTIIKEACPLVALEGRNFGLPILYSNSGGLPETAETCGTPLYGTSENEISQSIIDFCSNIERYQSLLKKTKDGLDYFSMDRMTREYVDFYLTMLKK
jgi:glycosyltransferase involved in cell wall biosynthesis